MKVPDIPPNEQQRLAALQRYEILDTLPEQEFNDIVQLAADICGTPIALISLIDQDRQWFKARVGLDASETSRDISFCGHVVSDRTMLIVPDATQDPRFADNPLVQDDPSIRFYAGAPLITPDQHILGTLCVIDQEPHYLTPEQIQRLEALSRLVISQLELRHNEQRAQRLAAVVESSNDAILIETTQGNIVGWNQATVEMFGYTSAELHNQPGTLFTSDVAECLNNLPNNLPIEPPSQRPIASQFETTYVRKDGTPVPVSVTVSPIKDKTGQITGVSKIIRDITESRNATAALQQNHQFLELIFDTIPLSIFWKNERSVYQGCNRRWAEIAGLQKPKDAVGLTDEQLPWTDDQRAWYLHCDRQVLNTGLPMLNIHQTQTQANGEVKWRQVNKVPIRNLDGRVIGLLGTVEDITERVQAEKELQQTNEKLIRATRLKDEFLANMSHELRTPLNAILGMTEALQEQVYGPTTAQQSNALQTIERSGIHLLELINDVLDVAKIESGQLHLALAPVSMGRLCQSSLMFVQAQAAQKQITLTAKLTPELPTLNIDERRIRQVLINLLNNAVKFTPMGGRVVLEAAQATEPTSEGDLEPSLWITVSDTGIGISPDKLPMLFQPFVQVDSALNRQYDGTGLGLALVKRLVELHGGEVKVTSEPNVGSSFSFRLPMSLPKDESDQAHSTSNPPSIPDGSEATKALSQPAASKVSQEPELSEGSELSSRPASPPTYPPQAQSFGASELPSPSSQAPLVLLVEDNEASIKTLASYLRAKGYRLDLARTGREAIALTEATSPDVILMDIQMPEMNGLEAIRLIRQNPDFATLPIVVLTAMMADDDRDRCLEAGATYYFSKPVRLKLLTQALEELLNFES